MPVYKWSRFLARDGRDGTGRDQSKVVQEVLADLKMKWKNTWKNTQRIIRIGTDFVSTLTSEYQNQWYISMRLILQKNWWSKRFNEQNSQSISNNKENNETIKIRAVEMNDYDEEALVARSRCNHTLGRNEAAIEDGELQVLCILNKWVLSLCILNDCVLWFESLLEHVFLCFFKTSFFSGSSGRPCQKQGVNIGDRGSGQGSMWSQITVIKIMIISRHWKWQKTRMALRQRKN